MKCYYKGKTSDCGMACAEWGQEARCLNEIIKNIIRPGNLGFKKAAVKIFKMIKVFRNTLYV